MCVRRASTAPVRSGGPRHPAGSAPAEPYVRCASCERQRDGSATAPGPDLGEHPCSSHPDPVACPVQENPPSWTCGSPPARTAGKVGAVRAGAIQVGALRVGAVRARAIQVGALRVGAVRAGALRLAAASRAEQGSGRWSVACGADPPAAGGAGDDRCSGHAPMEWARAGAVGAPRPIEHSPAERAPTCRPERTSADRAPTGAAGSRWWIAPPRSGRPAAQRAPVAAHVAT